MPPSSTAAGSSASPSPTWPASPTNPAIASTPATNGPPRHCRLGSSYSAGMSAPAVAAARRGPRRDGSDACRGGPSWPSPWRSWPWWRPHRADVHRRPRGRSVVGPPRRAPRRWCRRSGDRHDDDLGAGGRTDLDRPDGVAPGIRDRPSPHRGPRVDGPDGHPLTSAPGTTAKENDSTVETPTDATSVRTSLGRGVDHHDGRRPARAGPDATGEPGVTRQRFGHLSGHHCVRRAVGRGHLAGRLAPHTDRVVSRRKSIGRRRCDARCVAGYVRRGLRRQPGRGPERSRGGGLHAPDPSGGVMPSPPTSRSPAHRRCVDLAVGAAAVLLLFVAVPVTLAVLAGWPVPHHWDRADLVSRHAAFTVLALVAWVGWAGCCATIVRSVVDILGSRRRPVGFGSRLTDRVAVRIAAGVLVLGTLAGTGGVASAATPRGARATEVSNLSIRPPTAPVVGAWAPPPTSAPSTVSETTAAGPEPGGGPLDDATAQPTLPPTYQVAAGDSHWSIASQLYGDGADWAAIAPGQPRAPHDRRNPLPRSQPDPSRLGPPAPRSQTGPATAESGLDPEPVDHATTADGSADLVQTGGRSVQHTSDTPDARTHASRPPDLRSAEPDRCRTIDPGPPRFPSWSLWGSAC